MPVSILLVFLGLCGKELRKCLYYGIIAIFIVFLSDKSLDSYAYKRCQEKYNLKKEIQECIASYKISKGL